MIFQDLGNMVFRAVQIANGVFNKDKYVIPTLFNSLQVLSSASDKAKFFPESVAKDSNLQIQVSLYLFSLLELIWNCIIFL